MNIEDKVKQGVDYLLNNFKQLDSAKYIEIKKDSVIISFIEITVEDDDGNPVEYGEKIELSKLDFIKSIEEVKTAKFNEDKTVLNTSFSSYHVIEQEVFDFYDTSSNSIHIKSNNDNIDYNLSLERSPLTLVLSIFKFANTNDVFSVFSYVSIKIEYAEGLNKFPILVEDKLLDSLIFELFSKDRLLIERSYVWHFNDDSINDSQDEDDNLNQNLDSISIRNLEEHNEGIPLFLSALQVYDPELKMLSLYKVIEYFGPIVVKLEGNELLRKKLDSRKIYNPDGEFINSIFELVKATESRKKDKEIPKAVLLNCIDFIEIIQLLPESILNSIKGKSLEYDSKKQEIDKARNQLAEMLYATRNKVAHAKSNFTSAGNECPIEDLPQLNQFLIELCQRTIRWYNRLPQHQKLNS